MTIIKINCKNQSIEYLQEMLDIITTPDKRYEYFENLQYEIIEAIEKEIQEQTIFFTEPIHKSDEQYLVKIQDDRKFFPTAWDEVDYYQVRDNMMSPKQIYHNDQIRPDATHIFECGK